MEPTLRHCVAGSEELVNQGAPGIYGDQLLCWGERGPGFFGSWARYSDEDTAVLTQEAALCGGKPGPCARP